ncbi:MAG: class I SAM-dependent methyltransferase [Verrucomicrobiota bacterium]
MKSLRAYRKSSDLPLHRRLKGVIGNVLIALRPQLSAAVKAAPFRENWPATGKLIRNGHLLNAVAEKDHALICHFLSDFWTSQASDDFYTGLSHRYETLFLRHHEAIVAETDNAILKVGGNFQQLIEIGAGDGKIIEHFSRRLTAIPAFHAVDINGAQVANNRRVYADNPALSFHHADAKQWVADHAVPGTVLLANGGVLEYFTRPELESLLRDLAGKCSPCVIAITESMGTDHDLELEAKTYPYGLELSLSHNYLALLRECGFTIEFINDRLTATEEFGVAERWLQVVAFSQPPPLLKSNPQAGGV